MRKAAMTAGNATGTPPMQTITQTLRTVAAMAMILAGFALVSGWMSVAMAGGGKWAG